MKQLQFIFNVKVDNEVLKMRSTVKRFFEQMKPEDRKRWKEDYERKLAILNDQYDPGVYPLHHKLSGKRKPYPIKMPWMKSAWEEGLKILNEVINEQSSAG